MPMVIDIGVTTTFNYYHSTVSASVSDTILLVTTFKSINRAKATWVIDV